MKLPAAKATMDPHLRGGDVEDVDWQRIHRAFVIPAKAGIQ